MNKAQIELLSHISALRPERLGQLSNAESALLGSVKPALTGNTFFVQSILHGNDPLGEIFINSQSIAERRLLGATYTPHAIVDSMTEWIKSIPQPERIVDAGGGSGRFLVKASRIAPNAQLIGVELDPYASLITRATLANSNLEKRSQVYNLDFLKLTLDSINGRTLFISNPPYVRHHLISESDKKWFGRTSSKLGFTASKLAGLHAYFFLKTAELARPGDLGIFITSSEWLDVNYGKLIRALLLQKLGLRSMTLVDPKSRPFPDVDTTAVITTFEIDKLTKHVFISKVKEVTSGTAFENGKKVGIERLASQSRWTHLFTKSPALPANYVELGELCRVHRGQVTGNNRVWVTDAKASMLPSKFLFRSITRAKELFATNGTLIDSSALKCVIDLPEDLDSLTPSEFKAVEVFLQWAKSQGADQSYVARHRKAWWSVGLKSAPPIISTYMARRPPAFVHNLSDARLINIAHGIYPRENFEPEVLSTLLVYLQANSGSLRGRVYSGGLMKFEPREMERIPVPSPSLLKSMSNGETTYLR